MHANGDAHLSDNRPPWCSSWSPVSGHKPLQESVWKLLHRDVYIMWSRTMGRAHETELSCTRGHILVSRKPPKHHYRWIPVQTTDRNNLQWPTGCSTYHLHTTKAFRQPRWLIRGFHHSFLLCSSRNVAYVTPSLGSDQLTSLEHSSTTASKDETHISNNTSRCLSERSRPIRRLGNSIRI